MNKYPNHFEQQDSMARLSRISIVDVPVHLIQRGNNCQVCFVAEGDFMIFLYVPSIVGSFVGFVVAEHVISPEAANSAASGEFHVQGRMGETSMISNFKRKTRKPGAFNEIQGLPFVHFS
jgi:hypothetical protein